ncbi:hypothetical protein MKW98_029266, partial [Papaver atlanticum]
MSVTDSLEVNINDLTQGSTVSIEVLRYFIKQSSYHSSPCVVHDTLPRVLEIYTSLPKDSGDDVEFLGIDNTRRKLIRKELEDNNLIRRKKVKKGFQTEDDNNFTDGAPPTRDFGVLKKYVPSYSCFSGTLTTCLSKDLTFEGSINKIIQVKPLSDGYLHSFTNSNSGFRLNSLNWTGNYKEASSKVCEIEEASPSPHCFPRQGYEIPRKPPWFVAVLLLCGSLRRRKRKGDTTAHSTPCPSTTITAE